MCFFIILKWLLFTQSLLKSRIVLKKKLHLRISGITASNMENIIFLDHLSYVKKE